VRTRLAEPHVALALGALAVVAAEYGYRRATSDAWLLLEAASAASALLVAWREQQRLRLVPILALAATFQLAYLAVHAHLGVVGDIDSRLVFRWQGNAILDGYYPRSEYPVGAVLLFALEAWLGGGATRWANALLMVPFQLACVACVWAVRTSFAAWLAAVVAIWPLNAFSWEFKYDLAPTAFLALGIVLAVRGRYGWSGVALALGAALKWSPALAVLVLLVHLVARRSWRSAIVHAAAFAATLAAVYVPFLLWDADAVAAAYTRQADRPITAESVWYLPLHVMGLADVRGHISYGAGAPDWANVAAGVVQFAAVLAVVLLAARATPRGAAALAALAPTLFLLTNRIFSPQFVILAFVSWALAGALVVRTRREQLAVAAAAALASAANAFVYPFALPFYATTWQLASATLFVVGLVLTVWLAVEVARAPAASRA